MSIHREMVKSMAELHGNNVQWQQPLVNFTPGVDTAPNFNYPSPGGSAGFFTARPSASGSSLDHVISATNQQIAPAEASTFVATTEEEAKPKESSPWFITRSSRLTTLIRVLALCSRWKKVAKTDAGVTGTKPTLPTRRPNNIRPITAEETTNAKKN